ncbi:MAG: exodeoxyribonuclease III [Oscillospiraceae bacterium]|nr:exodeoxyribonuclease III [Oscillospiraceae bacterium]
MKFVSWNVNGLRACMDKGFMDYFNSEDADIFCLQETKLQPHQIELDLPGYEQIWHSAQRKGYSGTAMFTKKKPLSVSFGMEDYTDDEGRLITAEFDNFYMVTSYSPNSKEGLARIDYRMDFEDKLRAHLLKLEETKPVILCGDLNVAHNEIDLKNPKTNRMNAGFSDQEREKFTKLLESGHTDSFRYLYPDAEGAYSWWSYRFQARAKNAGWRIDYFVTSDSIKESIKEAKIRSDIFGSDHCPVVLEIDL